MIKTKKQIKVNNNNTSYSMRHTLIEDIIRHNVAQITSTRKANVPCLHAIIYRYVYIHTYYIYIYIYIYIKYVYIDRYRDIYYIYISIYVT